MSTILKQHKVSKSRQRKGQWHSAKTLERWRRARNKRNKVAHDSRRRNR